MDSIPSPSHTKPSAGRGPCPECVASAASPLRALLPTIAAVVGSNGPVNRAPIRGPILRPLAT